MSSCWSEMLQHRRIHEKYRQYVKCRIQFGIEFYHECLYWFSIQLWLAGGWNFDFGELTWMTTMSLILVSENMLYFIKQCIFSNAFVRTDTRYLAGSQLWSDDLDIHRWLVCIWMVKLSHEEVKVETELPLLGLISCCYRCDSVSFGWIHRWLCVVGR